MSAALIRSASCMHGVPAPQPRSGQSRLMRLGVLLLVMVFATTGCVVRFTTRQQSTSRAGGYSAKSSALTRSKSRTPVTTPQPTEPPQEGGRVF